MNNVNFDEYQISIRQKITVQTLIITFSLIILNAFIKSDYIWATPLVEGQILIYIPIAYYVTRSLFKNAYIALNEKSITSRILTFGILALLNIIIMIKSVNNHTFIIIQNGKLQDSVTTLLLGIFFLYLTLLFIFKKYLDLSNDE